MPDDNKVDLGLDEEKVEKFKKGYPKPKFSISGFLKKIKPKSFMERAEEKGEEAKEDRKKRKPNIYERAGQNQGDSDSILPDS